MAYILIFLLAFGASAAEKNKKPAPTEKTVEKAADKTAEKSTTEVYKADVFDLEGKEPYFTFEGDRTYKADRMIYTARFKDLQGQVVAEEKAEIVKGEIVHFESERFSTREKGIVETRDGRIHFTYIEKGKKSTKWENVQPDTVLSANFGPFLESHWDDLMAKKEVKFKYVVWYRQETIGFQFSHDSETDTEVVFKMNPTNMFYRSLVNPLYVTYDKKLRRMVSIKGRTLPKVKKGNSWRDFDAFIKYHY